MQSDVTHVPYLFVRNPGWHAFYDQDGAVAEATRRKVYDMLAAEKMMVQGFHYPFPAHAYIEKSGDGYRETMVPLERRDLTDRAGYRGTPPAGLPFCGARPPKKEKGFRKKKKTKKKKTPPKAAGEKNKPPPNKKKIIK